MNCKCGADKEICTDCLCDELDELRKQLESTANFLRGLTLDPAIPAHAKVAIHGRIHELEGGE